MAVMTFWLLDVLEDLDLIKFVIFNYDSILCCMGRRCGLVVQRANFFTGGRALDPKPRQPLSHSRDWGFTPRPGSGWQA